MDTCNTKTKEKEPLYLTVDIQARRIVMEGFYEGKRWYNDDGRLLKEDFIPIAWMPKFIPKAYTL